MNPLEKAVWKLGYPERAALEDALMWSHTMARKCYEGGQTVWYEEAGKTTAVAAVISRARIARGRPRGKDGGDRRRWRGSSAPGSCFR